jgi:hypothetical protein
MYRAKGGGRNLCALYSDRPPEHRELAELAAGTVEAGA